VTVRAAIFDLGHTLWDFNFDAGHESLTRAYVEFHAALCERTGRDDLPSAGALQLAVRDLLVADAPTYFTDGPELTQPPSYTWVDRGCQVLGFSVDEALLRELVPPLFATERERLICQDGTIDAVRDLRARGYAIGCVTNTLADTAAIRDMLKIEGFEEMMQSVVVSADEGWRKPHHSLFEKAARELDVAPGEAVFIGDSPYHDIGGAKAVGMRAVLTQQYIARPHEGFEPRPDAIIQHLRELPEVIQRLDAEG
jgi:HAD superfamily hydrolase (TIGR01662 family)